MLTEHIIVDEIHHGFGYAVVGIVFHKMLAHIFIILGTLDQCEETETVGESCDGLCILDSGVFCYGGQLIKLHIRIADGSYKVVDIVDAFA